MIKSLQPDMPTADEVLPWLRRIDETKVYVKGGPLVRQLEGELGTLLDTPCTVVANGTVSLELALRALNLRRGSGVLVPAVTFVATGQAIVNAGLVPVLVDVDPKTRQMPAHAAAQAAQQWRGVAAALPVAAYGLGVQIPPWEAFARTTGLPVLIDAAGAIYGQAPSREPAITISYSLNATKALGAGEGGVVATRNADVLERVASLANFGPGGTNGRMSEYHAAVALASLGRRGAAERVEQDLWYRELLPSDLVASAFLARDNPLLTVLMPTSRNAEAALLVLASHGVEAKLWYRPFLDERDELAAVKPRSLPVTDMLRTRVLGLPFHTWLTREDVAHVCAALRKYLLS